MATPQQQLDIATRALGQAVEASIRASHLVLHGQDATAEFAQAERLQHEADVEWDKVSLCDPTAH